MAIVTLDIETMKHPHLDLQIPVVVTISHILNDKPITIAIGIYGNEMLGDAGIDGAIAHM